MNTSLIVIVRFFCEVSARTASVLSIWATRFMSKMIALPDGGVGDDSFAGWHCRRWLRRVASKMTALPDFGVGGVDDSVGSRRRR